MKKLIAPLIIALFCFACDEEVQQGPNFTDSNPNDVEIRIDNQSNYWMDSIYLNTSGGEEYYGSLRFNRQSEYENFSKAYRIFHLRFYVNSKRFEIIPTDYVGEEKVPFGKYTLEISTVDTLNKTFSFVLKDD